MKTEKLSGVFVSFVSTHNGFGLDKMTGLFQILKIQIRVGVGSRGMYFTTKIK
jgi:hypothetical protein